MPSPVHLVVCSLLLAVAAPARAVEDGPATASSPAVAPRIPVAAPPANPATEPKATPVAVPKAAPSAATTPATSISGIDPNQRTSLMLIGGATFAASYVIAAGVGSQWNGTNYGLIPIAGPFIMTGQLLNSGPSCGADGRPLCDLGRTLLVLLAACTAIDGVAQIGGATLLIYGALAPDRVAVPEQPSARMVPFATPEGSGLAVVGRF